MSEADLFFGNNSPGDPDFFEALSPVIPIKERMTIVPSWYIKHKDPRGTTVTKNGQPIPPGFTVSDVVPERRWAIREDGEVLEQLEFQQAHEKWYVDQYRYAKQAPDDPNLRSIPNAIDFVCRTVDPSNPSKLKRIVPKPELKADAVQPRYNADGDLIAEAGEVEMPTGMSLKTPDDIETDASLAQQVRDLKEQIRLLSGGKVPPTTSVEEKQEAAPPKPKTPSYPDFTAPCGKPFPKGARFLHLHTMRCKSDVCVEAEAARKAAKE